MAKYMSNKNCKKVYFLKEKWLKIASERPFFKFPQDYMKKTLCRGQEGFD
jgi:hypothetical protein